MPDIHLATIASYDQYAEEYLHKKDLMDEQRTKNYWEGVSFFLNQLPAGSLIYEVGSGSGYDSTRIEALGFEVQRSDASNSLIKHLKETGFEVDYYDVLEGPLAMKSKAVYANAVLLHFDVTLFRRALANIVASLEEGGLLCLGMKLGDFEGWRDKGLSGARYFKFWTQKDLRLELVNQGLRALNEFVSTDGGFIVITATLNS